MIINLTSNAQAVIRRTEQYPGTMLRAVAAALDLENEYTLALVQTKRLSFPREGPTTLEGLRHISGRLKKSMRRGESDNIFSDAKVSGSRVLSSIGSNVRYAGVLEEGFSGEVSVKGHMRTRTVVKEFLRLGKRRFLKAKQRDVEVWGHTRQMNITGRHYLRRSVEERADEYSQAVSAAVVNSWNGGSK
jgi:hypothetical protein